MLACGPATVPCHGQIAYRERNMQWDGHTCNCIIILYENSSSNSVTIGPAAVYEVDPHAGRLR